MAQYNHTLSSPLIAVTSALAAIAWFILFIGSCVARFTGVVWFVILYELVVVAGIIILLALNVFEPYRNMAYLFLAISLGYLTWLCQWTLNRNDIGGASAATAGSVILIIIEFLWAIELTAPGGGTIMSGGSLDGPKAKVARFSQKVSNTIRPTDADEKKSYADEEAAAESEDAQIIEQLVAKHDYQANPNDPNELSFEKDDLIDILDKRGNWWKARKQDGTVGIVPSNYF